MNRGYMEWTDDDGCRTTGWIWDGYRMHGGQTVRGWGTDGGRRKDERPKEERWRMDGYTDEGWSAYGRQLRTVGWMMEDSWMEDEGQLDGGWRMEDSWMEDGGQLDGGWRTVG
jgi:hypothetical protein